ncbi:MAG: type IX secretion system sortase PorU, partial [Flavobacteriales bacterium]|nr:type IX secretion system sortase PorU [Flavobacteriales bacterium]
MGYRLLVTQLENNMNKRIQLNIAFFALFFISTMGLFSQNGEIIELEWKSNFTYGLEGAQNEKALNFTNAQYDFATSKIPFYVIDLRGVVYETVSLKNVQAISLSSEEATLIDLENVPSTFVVKHDKVIIKKRESSSLKISPIRNSASGGLEKLISFELETSSPIKSKIKRSKSLTFASQSALSSGEWYKIAVVNEGVFKLTRTALKNLGVDVDNVDPRNLKLYGYGGGMLPEANSESRPDDMQENAIFVSGEQDGSFDSQDFVLFYGEDQVAWEYDGTQEMFRHKLNLYSDTTFYYIKVGASPGKRISTVPSSGNTPVGFSDEFDSYSYYEKDNTNLLKSGREWMGEIYDNVLSYSVGFNSPNTVISKPGKIELYVIARSGIRSAFTLNVNNQDFVTDMGSVNLNRYDLNFARAARKFFDFTPNSGLITVNLSYNKPQVVAKGWLNFMTINVRRKLVVSDFQLQFRDTESVITNGTGIEEVEFQIQALPTVKVWDISDKYNITEMDVKQRGNLNVFQGNVSSLREYIAFEKADTTAIFLKGKVANQNLHGLAQADLLIISHPKFMTSANRVAGIHASEGLVVNVVTPQQIFNEYSSGSQDLIAMRSFIKMFYDRATNVSNEPKYVLMIGDASYDYKNRIAGNTNYIPAYQSPNSLDPVASHVSDDFVGLLDDTEGLWESVSTDRMDVAIGRFPVQTLEESEGIANKLEAYYSKSTMGDWRNKIVFVGDDEDGVVHMNQSNLLSKIVKDSAKDFNTQKIFLDAYQQQSTASGARYPEVTKDIVQAVDDGA